MVDDAPLLAHKNAPQIMTANLIDLSQHRFARSKSKDPRGMISSFDLEPYTPEQMYGLKRLFGIPAVKPAIEASGK